MRIVHSEKDHRPEIEAVGDAAYPCDRIGSLEVSGNADQARNGDAFSKAGKVLKIVHRHENADNGRDHKPFRPWLDILEAKRQRATNQQRIGSCFGVEVVIEANLVEAEMRNSPESYSTGSEKGHVQSLSSRKEDHQRPDDVELLLKRQRPDVSRKSEVLRSDVVTVKEQGTDGFLRGQGVLVVEDKPKVMSANQVDPDSRLEAKTPLHIKALEFLSFNKLRRNQVSRENKENRDSVLPEHHPVGASSGREAVRGVVDVDQKDSQGAPRIKGWKTFHGVYSLTLCLLAPLQLLGQFSTVSCTHGETGTCRQATTCNQSDIQAAINASASSLTGGYVSPTLFNGDGVYVPSGSCSWSSAVGWSNKNINLIGNNPTITHPSSDAFDVTVTNSGDHAAAFRISGFTASGSAGGHLFLITGSGQGSGSVPTTGTAWAGFFRFDHVTYNYSSGANVFQIYGSVFGLFDHLNGTNFGNHFEQSNLLDAEYNAMHSSNFVQFEGEYAGRILSAAPGSSSPGGLGSKYMDFIEDSTFSCPGNYSGAISDSESGGQRMVFRHNTLSGTCFWYAHWTRGDEWDGDLYEIYENTNTGNVNGQNPFRMEAGTGVVFNNSFPGTWTDLNVVVDDRRGDGSETSPHAGAPTGSNPIDGNAGDATALGWPLAGQIGNACLPGNCNRGTAAGGMGSLPLLVWNNTPSLGVRVGSAPNYIKTTAHTATNLNGAKDYCQTNGASQPIPCGIYNTTYTPYTYPNPLQGGSGIALTVSATNGSVSGTNCSTGSYASGTVVTCSATPNPGYAFTGWSTTGSASCSGTGTCGPFTLTSTTTVTANFAIASYTLSTATTGSGSATITGCAGSHAFGSTYTCTVAPSPGSTLTGVSGCGGSGTTTYTGSMPSSNCTVTAALTACTLSFSPPAGSYSGTQNVTISKSGCPTGTTIYYRTDGLPATVIDTQYSTPVPISSSKTLTAIAVLNPTIRDQPQTISGQKKCNAVGSPITFPSGYSCNNGSGGVAGNVSDFNFVAGSSNQWTVTSTDSSAFDSSILHIDTPTTTPDTSITHMSCRNVFQDSSNCTKDAAHLYQCVEVSEFDCENAKDPTTNALWQMSTRCSTNAAGSSGNNGFLEGDASSGNEKWDIPCVIGAPTDVTVNVHWTLGDTGCGGAGCMVIDSVYLKTGAGPLTQYNFPASCDASDTNCPNYPMTAHPTFSNFTAGSQQQIYTRNVSVAGTSPLTTTRSSSFIRIGVHEAEEASGSAAYAIASNTLVTNATNGSVSGTNCATGSYATGASIGACTATPAAGYSFTGWSGTGACSGASGTGTASCTLTSNATLTASFAQILTCGDPSQLSPNFSGTYIVPPSTLPMTVGFTSPTTGCTMHYTSDGSTPDCSSTAYPGGNFTISAVGTYPYRVIACQSGYTSSNVQGGSWIVQNASSVHVTLTGTQTFSGQGTNQ